MVPYWDTLKKKVTPIYPSFSKFLNNDFKKLLSLVFKNDRCDAKTISAKINRKEVKGLIIYPKKLKIIVKKFEQFRPKRLILQPFHELVLPVKYSTSITYKLMFLDYL